MIIDSVMGMKTNAGLLDAIKHLMSKKLSSNEIFEQRVSFVFGSMDVKNGVTKEHVRQVILDQVGATTTAEIAER